LYGGRVSDPGVEGPDVGGTGGEGPVVDGRRLRSDRSRTAVAEALLSLYEEGNAQPGAAEIARRAGVSERSVFRLFEDLDSLAVATIERELERVGGRFQPPSVQGPLDQRVRALVEQRIDVYGAMAAIARAAQMLVPRSTVVADAVRWRRDYLRQQIETLFAAELATRTKRRREEIVDAIDVLCSFEGFELLAATARHTPARTRRMLTSAVTALLHEPDQSGS
jgi:AcrR family transcriptional regulator